ncbi:putative hydrophobic protein (TIGR00271 family) [Agromyces terreus]|uniref:Hydrophobic protein (TIGR00271 family) n=1 Tax=Agromyces terreus TaxID=424795 RepID=A0A9X2KC98_9MICO|nr:DUF389 domain-containing protein [Agromyces terreus]MCP2371005.1 putative hydrophobic protein (TIGR00271 family) [Agromyces terreus]
MTSTDDEALAIEPRTNERMRDRFRSATAMLSTAVALRGLAAIVAGTAVLLLPDATTTLVTVIVVVLFAIGGVADLVFAVSGHRWLRRPINRWLAALRGLAALLATAVLGLIAFAGSGEITLVIVVAVLGVYIGIRGVVAVIAALLRRRDRDPLPRLAAGSIAIVAGVLAFVVPASLAATVIIAGATVSLLVGLVLIAWSVRRAGQETGLDPSTATITEVVWDWIEGSDLGRATRAEQASGLYFENPSRATKLGTWWVMLLLSVAIATFAVLADSTAVVIGAMLVAPLMTPILGLSGALVNGWGRRAVESSLLVLAGAVVAVALAYGIAAWAPVAISFDTNTQIISRVSPNTIDMLIALAAGAAGAFATVNTRVASGIAGVAIAVALVPPLAVVGVSLNGGRFDDAGGASLLFLTNFVAIVLAAAAVFVLTGFARPFALRKRPRQILQTVAPFVALAGIVMVPLMLTSEGLLQSDTRLRDAQETAVTWLGDDSDFIVTDVRIDGDQVQVTISGGGDPPSASSLRDALQADFDEPVGLRLAVVPVDVTVIPAPVG